MYKKLIFNTFSELKYCEKLSFSIKCLSEKKQYILYEMLKNDSNYDRKITEIVKVLKHDKFDELINNIDLNKIDLKKFKMFLINHSENIFDIKTINEINNYEIIRSDYYRKKLDNEIVLEKVKDLAFNLMFDFDTSFGKGLIDKYSSSVEKFEDKFLTKVFLLMEKLLLLNKKEDIIDFVESNYLVFSYDKITFEEKVKKEYSKMYNDSVFVINDSKNKVNVDGLDDIDVYNSGMNFNMLISGICFGDKYYNEEEDNYLEYESFYEEWIDKKEKSKTICCSYISDDMMGRISNAEIYFGFSNMADNSLLLSNISDMKSKMKELNLFVDYNLISPIVFLEPKDMINNTGNVVDLNYPYNEMTYKAFQNNKIKLPSYVVAFKENGKISNINIINKVVGDFKKNGIILPVVMINIDLILEQKRKDVINLLIEYEVNSSDDLMFEIVQKIKNNSLTTYYYNNSFYKQFEEYFKKLNIDYHKVSQNFLTR